MPSDYNQGQQLGICPMLPQSQWDVRGWDRVDVLTGTDRVLDLVLSCFLLFDGSRACSCESFFRPTSIQAENTTVRFLGYINYLGKSRVVHIILILSLRGQYFLNRITSKKRTLFWNPNWFGPPLLLVDKSSTFILGLSPTLFTHNLFRVQQICKQWVILVVCVRAVVLRLSNIKLYIWWSRVQLGSRIAATPLPTRSSQQ